MKSEKRIAVALSGGIDSSVAAWILQNQGYDVTGITMRHFDDSEMGFAPDNGIDAVVLQAKKVCDFLKIPHIVIDVQQKFSDIVVSDFVNEYQNGRTPNPCTLCNRTIKWGAFLNEIIALGFEMMATGHYISKEFSNDKYHLFRSGDMRKDQSYMLWQLNQQQLAKTLFPLAHKTKSQAREIITENNIPVQIDIESQEICFISNHYSDLLEKKMEFKQGNIVLTSGEIIGKHLGLPLYTIGQRKGLHTSLNDVLYVKELDMTNNRLIVTKDQNELLRAEFYIRKINWIADIPENDCPDLLVQIRYNSTAVEVAYLDYREDSLRVVLKNPVRAVTPGQSAVFYCKDELLGGGVID